MFELLKGLKQLSWLWLVSENICRYEKHFNISNEVILSGHIRHGASCDQPGR